MPNKDDTAWMLTCTAFVLLMAVPALTLFYGGLVRTKNMLSVLMQVFVGFSLIMVLWCVYGHSLAFTAGNAVIGGVSRWFLSATFDPASNSFALAGTFSTHTPMYERVYVALQATFAAITCCLILGALDFAGGTMVHVNAEVAGLLGAFLLGKRIGFGHRRRVPAGGG
jgi:Amt family ammonium transporter